MKSGKRRGQLRTPVIKHRQIRSGGPLKCPPNEDRGDHPVATLSGATMTHAHPRDFCTPDRSFDVYLTELSNVNRCFEFAASGGTDFAAPMMDWHGGSSVVVLFRKGMRYE